MKKYGILYKLIHTIKSTYLCIKYPFLFPRNRWTGKFYTNWKIEHYLYGDHYANGKWNNETHKMEYEFIPGLRDKAYTNVYGKNEEPDENGNHFYSYYIRKNIWYAAWFQIVKFTYDYILPIFHCIPTYNEWDAMKEGWNIAFGKQYLKELKAQLKKDNMLYSWRITDIKEKYGTLHLYCNYGSEDLYKIINKYENLSYYICIDCGKPATKISGGYICPYCDDCYNKQYGEIEPYYIIEYGEWKYNKKIENI